MRIVRILRITGLVFGALVLFLIMAIMFIPGRTIFEAANSGLSPYGLRLEAVSFGKAFPVGIKGKGITLSSEAGELLKLRSGRLSLELMPLLVGKVTFSVQAEIGSGSLVSSMSLLRSPSTKIEVKNVRLEDIPFFQTVTGIKASGILSGKAETSGLISRAKGYLQLDVDGAELSGIKIGEMPLPDASYRKVQGMVRISDGKASIESFTLQGDDLYVRLKGGLPLADPLPATPLNLSLELMPKPSLLEKQKLIFLLLVKFQDTPGHYLIPVKGTLGKPQVL
jgi:type II secretion system protein N